MNLSERLRSNAQHYPNSLSYDYLGEQVTYQELDDRVNRFTYQLAAKGIGKGDVVALLLGNNPYFVTAYYGVIRAGAIVVPINPTFTSRELSYILTTSKCKLIIAHSALQPVLNGLRSQLAELQSIIYAEPVENELNMELLMEEVDEQLSLPELDEEDVAVILFTSGTTGNPKGAMLTHRNLYSNAVACCELFEMTRDDRIIAVLPLFHVFCMTVCMNAPIICGSSMVIMPKFSPVDVVNTIRDTRATLFAGVPTMYNYIMQLPNVSAADFSSLRLAVSGGAPIPVSLLENFSERFQVQIQEGYGLSEASPVTAFNPIRGKRKPGSVGLNIPSVMNMVVDSEGLEVPRGEIGELIVKGPNVMKGYLGMPEETSLTIKDDWLYTGDLATMDEEGYIYIVDRKKDLILVGGYNVYPREVEEVLYQHPAIIEAAVIGVPDEQLGEAVKAYIVRKDAALMDEEIRAFLQDKLVKYKIPKYIEYIAELPKNSSGKILRKSLRETTVV
ncbi:long-chain fatty acid--CoA ligase [Paenibacillus albiflavus]|uniref:Long-chain fatty acid--CoA ligase n=1 Tax=Paenibacillus albiflavus TaxID=2545760 RepID=A0A4V2WNW9_9BACL|nr:long-chain-fatty-acid--CoA ligase [Paenibacillus albiflavus]TCZ77102.1 long-chain fatty acid--CoA ligase [Paenibacillus albiflavus]